MNKNYRINFQYMGGECIGKDEWEFDKAIIKINKKGMRRKGIKKELWFLMNVKIKIINMKKS